MSTPSPDVELTARIIMDRGSILARDLLQAHRAAWSSDTLTTAVKHLDDRDLMCLSVVAMIDAGRSEEHAYLSDLCDLENDLRNPADNACPTCDGDGQVVEVLTPGLHPADPAHDVKEWECPACKGTGQATDDDTGNADESSAAA